MTAENAEYLHELIRMGFNNSALYLWDMPLSDETVIGDFVYFDPTEYVFKPALLRFQVENGQNVVLPSGCVWGVVTEIKGKTGHLCTWGLCQFTTTTGKYTSATPGLRYLSTGVPGGTTDILTFPAVTLGFLVGARDTGEVQFFVNTLMGADGSQHHHRSFELHTNPCGNRSDGRQTRTHRRSTVHFRNEIGLCVGLVCFFIH